eukprot:Gb_14381 [translate_table: standard]
MDESDSIWQWCNARRKNCKGRQGAIGFASDALSSRCTQPGLSRLGTLKQQKESKFKKNGRYGRLSHELLMPIDFNVEVKNSDGQCLSLVLDPVEQPATPDLETAAPKTRKLEKLKVHRGMPGVGVASSSSSSVHEETSTGISSCASVVHDEVTEGTHLQSMNVTSKPSCSDKDFCKEEPGSLLQTLKFGKFDMGLKVKSLTRHRTLSSEMSAKSLLRNLHAVGNKKAKSKISFQGLDLLVNAICLVESGHADFVDQISYTRNKGLRASEQCIRKPFFMHTGLQKKRVLRRAKSAYKQRCLPQESTQLHGRDLPMAVDSKPDLKVNHLCELGIVQIVKHKGSQCLGGSPEVNDEDQVLQSSFGSKLRRSVQNPPSKYSDSVLRPRKKGSRR